jgi:O-antigen/teichoic acid export membrane protein
VSKTLEYVETDRADSGRTPRDASVRRWSKILAQFLSVQILVQVLSLLTGILLVRTLSQREYAFFTLANSLQATLIMLADVGISTALMATGGKVWEDRHRFGQLIQTGLQLRRNLALLSLIAVVPITGWLFFKNGAGWTYTLLLGSVVLLGAFFRLTNDVLIVVPRLQGRVDRLQNVELMSGGFRFATLGIACLTFVNATLAVLLNSLALGIQGRALRRWAAEGADLKADVNAEDRQTILSVIRQQAPNTIFYCVQGQLTVFLISVFGRTQNIAEVGALGRLGVLFALVSSVMAGIVQPRFSRAQDGKTLRKIYVLTLLGYAALSLGIMALALALPDAFLWILGEQYRHLRGEVGTMALSAVIAGGTGILYGMNTARAWMKGAWISIPVVILAQIGLLFVLDVSTVHGVILLGALPLIPGSMPFLYRAYRELIAFGPPQESQER